MDVDPKIISDPGVVKRGCRNLAILDTLQRSNHESKTGLATLPDLDPPQCRLERFRDSLFDVLDRPCASLLNGFNMFVIIADGALFFFLLVGWHRLCRPRRDCEPRNWWYNWSIQVLNVCFTYSAIVALPWRIANFIHLCPCSLKRRSNGVGMNLYGLPDTAVWFHVKRSRRLAITLCFVLNSVFQFINHGTRIYYRTYEAQDTLPGNILTNVFFAGSFLCAIIGVCWLEYEAHLLRCQSPGKFDPAPLAKVWKGVVSCCYKIQE